MLVAASADVDLLVVGSRGYGPVGAVPYGSASTALARAASRAVVVTPRELPFDLLS